MTASRRWLWPGDGQPMGVHVGQIENFAYFGRTEEATDRIAAKQGHTDIAPVPLQSRMCPPNDFRGMVARATAGESVTGATPGSKPFSHRWPRPGVCPSSRGSGGCLVAGAGLAEARDAVGARPMPHCAPRPQAGNRTRVPLPSSFSSRRREWYSISAGRWPMLMIVVSGSLAFNSS